jgi:hypothetical protein
LIVNADVVTPVRVKVKRPVDVVEPRTAVGTVAATITIGRTRIVIVAEFGAPTAYAGAADKVKVAVSGLAFVELATPRMAMVVDRDPAGIVTATGIEPSLAR